MAIPSVYKIWTELIGDAFSIVAINWFYFITMEANGVGYTFGHVKYRLSVVKLSELARLEYRRIDGEAKRTVFELLSPIFYCTILN
jgi:hypothetical protein